MPALTPDRIAALEKEYETLHPMAGVEQTMFDTFPEAVRSGELRWRDVEWVVRWYYRRHLTSAMNHRRKRAESAFMENEWPVVKETIESIGGTDDPGERVAAIATLRGIDIGVASAVLFFLDSGRDIVMDEPEWSALSRVTELTETYESDLDPSDYVTYLDHCRSVAPSDDLKALQRALWQLSEGS